MRDVDYYLEKPAHDLLEATGEEVTLEHREITGQDEYGDPETDSEEVEAVAEVILRGEVHFERRIEGISSDITGVAFVKHTVDVYDGSESDDRLPSKLHTATHSYKVHNWFDENNGKKRLHLVDD